MQVSKKVIKRLIDTGAAVDVSTVQDYRRPPCSTVIYYSVGGCGVNAAALLTAEGVIQVVLNRTSNLLLMIGG